MPARVKRIHGKHSYVDPVMSFSSKLGVLYQVMVAELLWQSRPKSCCEVRICLCGIWEENHDHQLAQHPWRILKFITLLWGCGLLLGLGLCLLLADQLVIIFAC